MTQLTGQEIVGSRRRTYHVQVPDDPAGPTVPLILVFHGGGQDAITIAKRWYVDPPNPMPGRPGPATCWYFRSPTRCWSRSGCISPP
ncbi:MAG TPA: hypothetical protein VE476_16815 [Propionibacteriaceae bacterium]|nr:hypothetical protein [Propionibacteriaceae bacterium]